MLIKTLKALDRGFASAIKGLVVLFLLIMVALVAGQVIMRNFFGGGLTWSDEAARSMVLWVAFFGAMLATRKRQHIAIDVLTRFIPNTPKHIVRIIIDAFCMVVAFYLAQAAHSFVIDEKMMGSTSFGQLPTWIVQVIIPFGFAMIAFEYLIGIGLDIWKIFHGGIGEKVEGGRE